MFRLLLLVAIQSVFLSGAQVMLKLASARIIPFSWSWPFFKSVLWNGWLALSGIAGITAFVLWTYILKRYPFGVAYPLSCMGYVFGLIAAMLVFHETINWNQWLGIVLIMAGCFFIAK
jgi:undecaprenyl phosphate-alpha-L-ara4N flippase subunit ArnE